MEIGNGLDDGQTQAAAGGLGADNPIEPVQGPAPFLLRDAGLRVAQDRGLIAMAQSNTDAFCQRSVCNVRETTFRQLTQGYRFAVFPTCNG